MAQRLVTVTLEDIVLTRGSQTLINGFSTVIADADCVGLFGPNGAGKSSLLLAIAGQLPTESGHVILSPPGATVGYLPQLRSVPADWTLIDALVDRTGASAATDELQRAAERLEIDDSRAASAHFEQALARFLALGADSVQDRAPALLARVGLDLPLDRTCAGLSGGELARLGLASILLSEFDVLLLDEPTNDLDEQGLRFLIDFVAARVQPVVVVSHDRAFLRSVITSVVEFDPKLDQVLRFEGGYEAWRTERARAREAAVEANELYTETVADLKAEADAIRRRSAQGVRNANRAYQQGRVDKLLRDRMLDGATAGAASARSTRRQLEKLERPAEVRKVWNLQLAFPESPRGPREFVLNNVTVTREEFTLGPISLDIGPGERIRVHGRNGSGKSLLLDTLTGAKAPSSGRRSGPSGVEVGVLDQDRSVVPLIEQNLAEWFSNASAMVAGDARTHLAKFGLGSDDVSRPMSTLSPGERTRVALALLAAGETSTLVLDEPTNHLDLPAIEQLESALACYCGTVIITTHDEEFAAGLNFDRTVNLAEVSGGSDLRHYALE